MKNSEVFQLVLGGIHIVNLHVCFLLCLTREVDFHRLEESRLVTFRNLILLQVLCNFLRKDKNGEDNLGNVSSGNASMIKDQLQVIKALDQVGIHRWKHVILQDNIFSFQRYFLSLMILDDLLIFELSFIDDYLDSSLIHGVSSNSR